MNSFYQKMHKKMLIIDDDADILDALETVMNMEGFSVTISTKSEVINSIDINERPDMIIMDVMLSGVDGRIVCKRLKTQETTKNIPVLMISAHPDVKKSTLKAGADAFLSKPFDTNDLVSKVNHLIN